jgi:hypothetical protein
MSLTRQPKGDIRQWIVVKSAEKQQTPHYIYHYTYVPTARILFVPNTVYLKNTTAQISPQFPQQEPHNVTEDFTDCF